MPVILYTPKRFGDSRGWFSETYHETRFKEAGIGADFIQDNQSLSAQKGTLRGLHFQTPPFAQAKLVRCLAGAIFDVAVDVRNGSPTYGNYVSAILTAEKGEQLYIPEGFAHAFMTLEENCMVSYKVNAYYAPHNDGGLRYDDPNINIKWPLSATPHLSEKDEKLPFLKDFTSPFAYDGRPLAGLS
jgi:dTDP-4-dehydrorhamnose 3,5-epimerase